MSLALHDLMACCRQLESDKAAERKKEIEKFKRLIHDPDTIQELDRNSDSKHGKQMNWDTIFRYLERYVKKETENARVAKPNVSASTQATRQKKMQEISGLVKYFIRCANKRAPRLKCHDLLIYVMDTVSDPSSCPVFGADSSSILLKDILAVRKYWCEIPLQQWSDLQNLYWKLFLKPSRDINRVLVARIIYTLTRSLCFQTEGLNSNLFNFFSKAVQCIRQEKNPAGLDHIFAAINIFFSVFAINYRMRICKLGEQILPTVLYIWTQYRPNDSLKEQIIQLVQLQVRVHHPNGAKTQEKGAYSSAKWEDILYNLYGLLTNEINVIGSRGKYSSGSRSVALKENLVELMADICHQVFIEDSKVLEITQSYAATQRECGDGEGPSKRRRIELGWEVIRDNLQRSQNDFDVIPWLQITARLIAKYPMSLPYHELPLLLSILYQLSPHHRRGERTPYVLRCLKEVALCQSQKTNLKTTQKSELQRTWSKIWALVVRSLNLQQTEAEHFGLLGVMIQGNLVKVDRDIWKIFSGFAYKPSK